MVSLRRAVAEDAGEMARVQVEALREQGEEYYTEKQLTSLAPTDYGPELISDTVFEDRDTYAVVAEQANEFAGFAVLHTSDGYLAGIFVDPYYAGAGIGTALVEEIEQHARENNVDQLSVIASLNAVGFYKSAGFTKTEETEVSREATTIPAVEMEKKL
jgi:putative acetyltransferase